MIIIKDEMSILQSEIDAIIEYLHSPIDSFNTLHSEIYSDIIVRLWGLDAFTVSSSGNEGISYNAGIVYDNKYRKKSRPSGIDKILHKLRFELGPFCDVQARNVITFQHSNTINIVEREVLLELLTNSGCIITKNKYIDKHERLIPQWAGIFIKRGHMIIPSIIKTTMMLNVNSDSNIVSQPPFIVDLEDPQYCSIVNSFLGSRMKYDEARRTTDRIEEKNDSNKSYQEAHERQDKTNTSRKG